jgi:hypothetical protein
MDHQSDWVTVREVESRNVFDKVKIGDDVAILQHGEGDWWTGIVMNISTYNDRATRFRNRPVLHIKIHGGPMRSFYEDCVAQVLFKD